MADTPEDGVRQVAGASSPTGAVRAASVEMPDEDDEQTNVTPAPLDSLRSSRPSLKRRITRPSFVAELKEGSPVGEYEILAQIGEGAMGTVYSAVHPLIGKQVAIKILKPELCANQATIDRFVTEAQAVNKIGHPNIVDVFSLGELDDGRAYMVMEWLRGEDLKARIARGLITVPETCDILDGVARALEAAHSKGIIHRDLKPDNVFLHRIDNGPTLVKLLDFGIAKLVRVTPGTEKTQTGNMLGTPRYISPEQSRGVHVDHRTDIYSLGVIAFEMLAGRPPFMGETAMDIVVQHLNEPPPDLGKLAPRIPKSLEQCVMRMLEKDPNRRPSLEEIRGILMDPARRLTPLPAAMPSLRPASRWPIYAIAAVAAVGLGVLTWKLVGGDSEKPKTTPGKIDMAVDPKPEPVVEPEIPVTPPSKDGMLTVTVTGAKDSEIYIDGDDKGHGPELKVVLLAGRHKLTVKAPGRAPFAQEVTIIATENTNVLVPLQVAAEKPPARPPQRPPKRDTSKPTKEGSMSKDDELLTPKRHK